MQLDARCSCTSLGAQSLARRAAGGITHRPMLLHVETRLTHQRSLHLCLLQARKSLPASPPWHAPRR